jgi:hypothetical protein
MKETINLPSGAWQVFSKKNHFVLSKGSFSKVKYTNIRVGNRIVGSVKDGVFIKTVKASKHFLRVPPAIAFDIDSLKRASEAGAHTVRVIDTDCNRVYVAPISTIWSKGFEVNRGFGRQIALLLKYWNTVGSQYSEQLGFWR